MEREKREEREREERKSCVKYKEISWRVQKWKKVTI